MSDEQKLLERIQELEAYCTDYANDLAILEAENDQLHNILDALREPSEKVVDAVHGIELREEWYARAQLHAAIIRAAVTAAEQEVGRE